MVFGRIAGFTFAGRVDERRGPDPRGARAGCRRLARSPQTFRANPGQGAKRHHGGSAATLGSRNQHLATLQGDAWVAAGDAACAWDPLSSAGILKALRTGRLAAFVALDAMQGRLDTTQRYTRILRREHAAYLEERARFYSLEGRWRDAPFWRRHAVPAMSNDTMKTSPAESA